MKHAGVNTFVLFHFFRLTIHRNVKCPRLLWKFLGFYLHGN